MVELEPNQREAAENYRERYFLYAVYRDPCSPLGEETAKASTTAMLGPNTKLRTHPKEAVVEEVSDFLFLLTGGLGS